LLLHAHYCPSHCHISCVLIQGKFRADFVRKLGHDITSTKSCQ
jgi:hypothetical protein